jgi:hypothetical protein
MKASHVFSGLRSVLFCATILGAAAPFVAHAQIDIGVSVGIAPPELPYYAQPPIPAPDYLWTPGYWAWDGNDYYWVPGTWVQPPTVGVLWTPPYWGWSNGAYLFHNGYWGPHIGFYGGINYGFGYGGVGFGGGYWNNNHFFYNRAVMNVTNVNITNVYNSPVQNFTRTHAAFNGGPGGVALRPTASEERIASMPHTGPTAEQTSHSREAGKNPELFSKANGGHPPIAATSHPGEFKGAGVVPAQQATNRTEARPNAVNAAHPSASQNAQTGARVPRNLEAPVHNATTPEHSSVSHPATTVAPHPSAQMTPRTPNPRASVAHSMPTASVQSRPAMERPATRPVERAAPRPVPQARPTPRPAPEARPAPRPAPEAHPAPRPEEKK